MKTPLTRILKLAGCLLGLGAVPAAQAQYVPLVLTGLNADVVADGTGPSISSTSVGLDNGNYVLMAPSFNPAGTSSLPASGLINSAATAGLIFQLAAYTGNNSLRLPATAPGTGTGTATLTFGAAQPASDMFVLATSGDGASAATFTLNFSDGTSQAFPGLSVSDWFNGSGFAIQGIGRVQRGIDNRENSATNPRLYQLRLTVSAANAGKSIQSLTVNKTSTTGVLNVMAATLSSVCSGTPTGGTAAASVAGACSSTPISLTLTGASTGVGITYQWQRSPAGAGTFTNLGAAQPTSTYNGATQTAATDYRVVVSCTGSGQSATSSTVTVTQNTFINCYCTPQGGNCSNEWIRGLTLGSITNTGTACSAGGYADYTATTPAIGATLTRGALYPVSLDVHLNTASSQAGAWVDFDRNGTFDASEFVLLGTGPATGFAGLNTTFTGSLTVPATAQLGQTRLRVRLNNGALTASQGCLNSFAGEVEDYFVTIAAAPACAGTPTGGTATASSLGGTATAGSLGVCPGTSFTLGATGYSGGVTGLTFQWQSAPITPIGTPIFTDIAGATTVPYTVTTGPTVETGYRLRVTCAASSQSAFSSVVTVGLNAPLNCYCVPTYASGGNGDYIGSVTVGSSTRNTASLGNVAPYYHSYGGQLGNPGSPATPVFDLATATTANVVLTFGPEANQYSAAWVDFDQSGTFDANEFFSLGTSAGASGTATIPVAVPATATLGLTRMRVRGGDDAPLLATHACGPSASAYGEAEDYLINVVRFMSTSAAQAALGLTAYPNPAGAALTVRVAATPAAGATVQLLDLTGRLLLTAHVAGQQTTVGLDGLATGLYLLRYTSGQVSQTIRISKQ